MSYWFSLFSWCLSFCWLRGHNTYRAVGTWTDPQPHAVVQNANWPHGTGKVSWWKFAKALRYVAGKGQYVEHPEIPEAEWLTPERFYQIGGVCKDFATAILYKAVELGCSPDALGWLYLKRNDSDSGHIMAALLVDGDMWLADNNRRIPERASRILDDEWKEYTPVAWFNDSQALVVVCGGRS